MADEATPEIDVDALRAEAETARQEATAARREAMIARAGIDPDSAGGKLIARGYDGDLSVDNIRAFAVQAGLLKAPEPDEVPADEKALTEQRRDLATGGQQNHEPPDPHPAKAGIEEAMRLVEQGSSRENAAAAYFGRIFAAAANGDQRVLARTRPVDFE